MHDNILAPIAALKVVMLVSSSIGNNFSLLVCCNDFSLAVVQLVKCTIIVKQCCSDMVN